MGKKIITTHAVVREVADRLGVEEKKIFAPIEESMHVIAEMLMSGEYERANLSSAFRISYYRKNINAVKNMPSILDKIPWFNVDGNNYLPRLKMELSDEYKQEMYRNVRYDDDGNRL